MRTLNTLLSVMGLSALIALPVADAADYTYLEMSGKLTLTRHCSPNFMNKIPLI